MSAAASACTASTSLAVDSRLAVWQAVLQKGVDSVGVQSSCTGQVQRDFGTFCFFFLRSEAWTLMQFVRQYGRQLGSVLEMPCGNVVPTVCE